MNKLILVFAAIAITAGAYAQAGSTDSKKSQQDLKNTQDQNLQNNQQDLNKNENKNLQNNPGDKTNADGVVMQNGKMMQVKNGKMTTLQNNDLTMSNGTRIMSDGTCIKKDGTKTTMKEGQHMDMEGNMIPVRTNNDKNADYNQNMQNNPGDKSHADGVMMQNGKVMMVKNGKMTILDHDMTTSNGTKIMSDGTYVKKDGTKMTLKEGQHIDMSGNMIPMKTDSDKIMYLVPDSTLKNNN